MVVEVALSLHLLVRFENLKRENTKIIPSKRDSNYTENIMSFLSFKKLIQSRMWLNNFKQHSTVIPKSFGFGFQFRFHLRSGRSRMFHDVTALITVQFIIKWSTKARVQVSKISSNVMRNQDFGSSVDGSWKIQDICLRQKFPGSYNSLYSAFQLALFFPIIVGNSLS